MSLTVENAAQDFRALLTTITSRGGIFLVLGRTDVGKSTLIQNFVRLVTARGHPAVVLDADLGQSTYGLPTTLNLVRFSPEAEGPQPQRIASIFVGATSPVGHLLQTLVGCRRLLDRALELGVRTIFIDTTGLVEGPLAVEFKLQKIDLLRPTHILALARKDELEPILRACDWRNDLVVHRLPVATAARERSAEERRAHRQDKYRSYFTGLVRHRFRPGEVGIWGRLPRPSAGELTGLLVGLNDGQGFCLSVGRLTNRTTNVVEVLAPWAAVTEVKMLRFGSVAIDSLGNERYFSPRDW
jgi:polynucleotide 5'-hydroxyl-kinase GRC3/NOL9